MRWSNRLRRLLRRFWALSKVSRLLIILFLSCLFASSVSIAKPILSPGQKAFLSANQSKTNRTSELLRAEKLLQSEVNQGTKESSLYLAYTYWHLGTGPEWSAYDTKALGLMETYTKGNVYSSSKLASFEVAGLLGQLYAKQKRNAEAEQQFKFVLQFPAEDKGQDWAMTNLLQLYQQGVDGPQDLTKVREFVLSLSMANKRQKYLSWIDGITQRERQATSEKRNKLLFISAVLLSAIAFFYAIYRRIDSKKRIRNHSNNGFEFRVSGSKAWYSLNYNPTTRIITARLPNRKTVLTACPSTFSLRASPIATYEKHEGFAEKSFGSGYTNTGQYVSVSVPTGRWIEARTVRKETDQSSIKIIIDTEKMLKAEFDMKGRELSIHEPSFETEIMPVDKGTANFIELTCKKWL
jgi:hypothetical protein